MGFDVALIQITFRILIQWNSRTSIWILSRMPVRSSVIISIWMKVIMRIIVSALATEPVENRKTVDNMNAGIDTSNEKENIWIVASDDWKWGLSLLFLFIQLMQSITRDNLRTLSAYFGLFAPRETHEFLHLPDYKYIVGTNISYRPRQTSSFSLASLAAIRHPKIV